MAIHKKFFVYLVCLIFLALGVVPQAFGEDRIEFNVSLKPGSSSFAWPETVEKIRQIPGTTLFRIWVDSKDKTEILEFFESSGHVNFIEQVKSVHIQSEPVSNEYTWENIIEKGGLLQLSTGSGTIVAVLDTGIDLENALFVSMLFSNSGENPEDGIDNDKNGYVDDLSGWDMGDMDNVPMDEHEHGTMVTSILARIAPQCTVLPVKLNSGGGFQINTGELAEGIYYAVQMKADIINLSVTITDASMAVQSAVKAASTAGCIIVGASGNYGGAVEFPAAMEEVVAVGSMYDSETIAYWFSPQGPELDIVAPGVAVEVTTLGNTSSYASGTSFSTPMISGAAALLKSKFPGFSSFDIIDLLYSGSRDLGNYGRDDIFGHGILDGTSLLNAVYDSYDKIGHEPGIITKQVGLKDNYYCMLNMTPKSGDTPVQEWILIGGIQGGQEFSFFYNGKEFIDWDTAVDYPADARVAVTTEDYLLNPLIPELNLEKLGYSIVGEKLWYCYAYTTDKDIEKDIADVINQGNLVVKNLVSLSVAD
ncbi:MAG: S8 family serine peptidase [Desulfobacterium sp.]|nr:S8 family serine peptidase [Desulfobacterium sp.]